MLCSRQEVLQACFGGDAAEACRLANAEPTTWDGSLLDEPIATASSDIEVAAGNKWNLPYSADSSIYPKHIRGIAARRAGHYYWLSYAKGKAEPENLKTAKADTDQDLTRMRETKEPVGMQKQMPVRLTSAEPVDTTLGGHIPRMSLSGWAKI